MDVLAWAGKEGHARHAMTAIKIRVSLVPSPLTTPLLDGGVGIQGAEVVPNASKTVDENSRKMLQGAYDVAEMSLATFLSAAGPDSELLGLPVFPGRRFIHGGMLCRPDAGIRSPADLAGRKVGIPQYWLTSSVWHRGILRDEFGVDTSSIDWVTVTPERGTASFPREAKVTYLEGVSFQDLLIEARTEALLMPRTDLASLKHPRIAPIFPDVAAAQQRYFAATGIFPIMHFIVMRRELHDRAPALAGNIIAAFETAKTAVMSDPAQQSRLEAPIEGTSPAQWTGVLGQDPWKYGIEANRKPIETFLRYAQEEGLVRAPMRVDDLFATA
jgi:4,5-dihydroxyphthalate decarboxylase